MRPRISYWQRLCTPCGNNRLTDNRLILHVTSNIYIAFLPDSERYLGPDGGTSPGAATDSRIRIQSKPLREKAMDKLEISGTPLKYQLHTSASIKGKQLSM